MTRNARAAEGSLDPNSLGQSALIAAARTLAIECPDVSFTLADFNDTTLANSKYLASALASMVPGEEYLVRHGKLLVSRLAAKRPEEIALRSRPASRLPRHANFALTPQRPHGIDTLIWQECRTAAPGAAEVCVRISAAGLNFRDVMAATGLLPRDAEKDNAGEALGLEFAGTIEGVGAGIVRLPPARAFSAWRAAACAAI